MKRPVFACVLALAVALPAAACGWDAPNALGLLNVVYPESLHVRSAVWQARRDGLLPAAEVGGFADPALEQQRRIVRHTLALNGLRKRLEAAGAVPSPFSVVLLQPVLWSRFEAGAGALRLRVHEPGPGDGDAVLVTEAAVLAALADGRIDMPQARELGLLRLYGAPDAVHDVERLLDRLNPAPQP